MSAQDFRNHIVRHLRMIADPTLQLAYQKRVPIADVAAELVCQWFDDFHPDSVLFQEAFSHEEISELAEFSIVFNKCVDQLPNTLPEMLASPIWGEVMREARETLARRPWL